MSTSKRRVYWDRLIAGILYDVFDLQYHCLTKLELIDKTCTKMLVTVFPPIDRIGKILLVSDTRLPLPFPCFNPPSMAC